MGSKTQQGDGNEGQSWVDQPITDEQLAVAIVELPPGCCTTWRRFSRPSGC